MPELKHGFFQFHLLTAMVMMLAASVLLALNFHAYRREIGEREIKPPYRIQATGVGFAVDKELEHLVLEYHGWPLACTYRTVNYFTDENGAEIESKAPALSGVSPLRLAADVLAFLVIVAAAATGCEWWLRAHPPPVALGPLRRRLELKPRDEDPF